MSNLRQEPEPCGVRLMRLMDTRLLDIIRKEHSNSDCIYLYGTGEYWAAFERSAYLLCRIFPGNEIAGVTHPAFPFPVVMASIPDRELKAYSRRHIFRRDEPDYKELVAAEIVPDHYQIWHQRELRELL